MRNFFGVFTLFVGCFAVGFGLVRYTTDVNQINRDPAAVRGGFDFTGMQGEQLHQAVKQRLLAGFEMTKLAEGAQISLGHFVFSNSAGERRLACQEFGRVSLTFEAEGSSVGGDKPSMEIEGRCESSADFARINPLLIPIQRIIGERPADGEFQFNEGSPVNVRFVNVADQWPRLWLLKSVKLTNDASSSTVVVESDEVAQILGHPVVLSW